MTPVLIDIVTFAGATAGAAVIAWLVSGWTRVATIVSSILLAGSVVLAGLLQPEGRILIADRALAWDPYVRLWLVAAAGSLLALHLVGLAAGRRTVSGAVPLAALAAMAVALTLDEPLAALLVLTAACLATALRPATAADVRATTATALLSLVGAAFAANVRTPGHAFFNLTHAVASSLLVGVAAVAVRAGVAPVARPRHSLFALSTDIEAGATRAWLPATTLIVLVTLTAGMLAPTGGDLSTTSETIRLLGVGALAATGLVALVAGDVRILTGATVIANASLVAFALVPQVLLQPDLGPRAVAVWMPLFAVTATWAVAWSVALHATESELEVRSVRGWARRRPVLAAALIVGGALSYGWPGSLPWEARAAFLDVAIEPGDLRRAAGILAWVPALGLARLLLAGLRHGGPYTTATVSAARRHSMAHRVGLGRVVRRASVAEVLVLLFALAPALLAPGLGDLPAIAASFRPGP